MKKLFFVVMIVFVILGCSTRPDTVMVTYSVNGSGVASSIMYADETGSVQTISDRPLGWAKSVTFTEGESSYAVLSAIGDGSGPITATISVDGEIVKTSTTDNGLNVTASIAVTYD